MLAPPRGRSIGAGTGVERQIELTAETLWNDVSARLREALNRSEERRVGKEWGWTGDWSSDVCSSDLGEENSCKSGQCRRRTRREILIESASGTLLCSRPPGVDR